MHKVLLPELGEDIEKATVVCWHAGVGDHVAADDDIVEIESDKATFNVSAGASGILKEVLVPEGQEAKVGQPLAVILSDE
jgi:pyruvate dehydrogenase E2 component (dihydrolipoamide acetyltransferase)